MQKKKLRRKMLIQAAIVSTCLFEAVGCPQIFANSIKMGTRDFLETGLPAAIWSAMGLDDIFSSGTSDT